MPASWPSLLSGYCCIRIWIISFWKIHMSAVLVTIIYKNKHDSRIYPGNRHKNIYQLFKEISSVFSLSIRLFK